MKASIRRIEAILVIIVALMVLPFGSLHFASSAIGHGAIDLFTQKDPFNGKGQNATSDSFAPGDEVQLYAYISYNNYEVPNIPVAFEVQGPANSVNNVTFFRTALTNNTGIAAISFRLPYSLVEIFGIWNVRGNVRINDTVIQDFIKFRVGWIVELTSLRTLDQNHMSQDKFVRGSNVTAELALKSIAMTNKNATLTVNVLDSMDRPISSGELRDFIVPPNTTSYAYITLHVSENASIGTATAYASAFTMPTSLGGIPYCPDISCQFMVIIHEIAITNVKPFPVSVHQGQTVYIDVTVLNKGTETESFPVTVYANDTLIGTISAINLRALQNATLQFRWNTTHANIGIYQISAYAQPVQGQIDQAGIRFTDGFVQITPSLAPGVHAVEILNVTPSASLVQIGDSLNVDVVVRNVGNFSESFFLTVLYNDSVIDTVYVNNLEIGASKDLTINWSTNNVVKGNYTIAALVNLTTGEENAANGYFKDGIVRVIQSTKCKCPITWFFNFLCGFCRFLLSGFSNLLHWFYDTLREFFSLLCGFYRFLLSHFWWFLLLLLLALIVALLIAWFARRRRLKKKLQGSFDSAWTAWYYGDGLKSKMP